MSRTGWRVSRALRVVLACLALWLPARSAMGSFAATDTVVMIGRGAGVGAVEGSGIESSGTGVEARSSALRRADEARAAPPARWHGPNGVPPAAIDVRYRHDRSPTRSSRAPLYLLDCAILR